jgi:hypothetical protein
MGYEVDGWCFIPEITTFTFVLNSPMKCALGVLSAEYKSTSLHPVSKLRVLAALSYLFMEIKSNPRTPVKLILAL